MKKVTKKIDELIKITRKLIHLTLEIGTLVAVIKLILDNLWWRKGATPTPKRIITLFSLWVK